MAKRTIKTYAGYLDTPYDPEYGLDLVAQAESLTLQDEVERLNALERLDGRIVRKPQGD